MIGGTQLGIIERIRARIGSVLDIPLDAMGEGVSLTTGGFLVTTVEGCDAILDYSPEQIVLSCSGSRITLEGIDLKLNTFSVSSVRIYGKVNAVYHEERRR